MPARIANESQPTESWLQRSIVHFADERVKEGFGAYAWLHHIPNAGGFTGGHRHNAARVVMMKREGVRKGIADLFLPLPRTGAFGELHGIYLELKRPGAKKADLKPEQLRFIHYVRGHGSFLIGVLNDLDEALAWLTWYVEDGTALNFGSQWGWRGKPLGLWTLPRLFMPGISISSHFNPHIDALERGGTFTNTGLWVAD